uniref:Uncharacterized protein n=1 Tax=Myoviridae sp. ctxbQ4 TaxID=2827292 RepID=A0A8S5R4V2_9CAUD|nr:MAG TPA: hypothetical protein [Myoviridae sp. ctxbQ4]
MLSPRNKHMTVIFSATIIGMLCISLILLSFAISKG